MNSCYRSRTNSYSQLATSRALAGFFGSRSWCHPRGNSGKRGGLGNKPGRDARCNTSRAEHSSRKKQKVAVVGAGAAGLVCCRELRDEGHNVSVFEQAPVVGGTWVLDKAMKSLEDDGEDVHSSMYDSLRTNLPREVMSFSDFPFTPETLGGRSVDSRRYPSHHEVLVYLESFADAFDLRPMIRFRTRINEIQRLHDSNEWSVSFQRNGEPKGAAMERFDAVVVCNGHYAKPQIPPLEGSEEFPGMQLHSHTYRHPRLLAGKVVVVFGISASGQDIARDIASVCETVYLSGRSAEFLKGPGAIGSDGNVVKRSAIRKLGKNGEVWFQNGEFLDRADAIMYCTGYEHFLPFLSESGLISTEGNRVSPLYKHIFEPQAAPSLAFIGLPKFIIPFPLFEYQSKLVARVLSGRCQLPSKEDMELDIENFYKALEEEGRHPSTTHNMRMEQFSYFDWLQAQCGPDVPVFPKWRSDMFEASSRVKKSHPERYRDVFDDEISLAEAKREFSMIVERSPIAAKGA
ncbi:hypothetical protein BSKO_08672 [Bryopsis sp. KO-2023]|nr:hypothetical protein BSKO_08672 [Bryopsis sp. KO-2023]